MTLTLDLPPEVEGALAQAAHRQGRTPEQIALEDLKRLYAPETTHSALFVQQTDPTLALFAQWAAADATDDPEEIARRQNEGDELMAVLQANRFNLEGRTDFQAFLGHDVEGGSLETAA